MVDSHPTSYSELSRADDASQAVAWEVLARKNPLWAVCSSGKRRVDWDLDEFLRSGDREIAWTFAEARNLNILPEKLNLILDFGCGPGRLLRGLGESASHVIGIDVSPTMLGLARRSFPGDKFEFHGTIKNVGEDSVDLAYSTFVLQHLTDDGRRDALASISKVLRPGGLFIFQFPDHPKWTFGGLAWKVLPLPSLMWIQRHILRFPEAMPMRWANSDIIKVELDKTGLDFVSSVTGLTYSPNWLDTWYFAVRR